MTAKENHDTFEGKWYAHPPMRNALIAAVISGLSFGLAHGADISALLEKSLYIVSITVGGVHWIREGLEELVKEKKIGIEILMMGATIGSMVLGMWDEAAFLVVLYGVAEGIEEYTYAKTRGSIRKLLDLAPKEAHVLKDGKETVVEAENLQIGDIFRVRPGEALATDGVIIKGSSSINEAPVTGESIPVEKQEGMKVFAGTVNQQGVLEIKVTALFQDNTLSKIIHLVEEAQEQKGRAQLFIDKFGTIYSPLVLLGAVLLMVIPYLLGWEFSEWARRAVVLLVAAAPCALVMSTPVAVAAGIGNAGKHGVLIKGGAYLETLGAVRAVALDKTGTLTKGKPVVTNVVPLNGDDEKKILQMAFSVERLSEHPLAKAIVEKATEMKLGFFDVSKFESLTGQGVKANWQDDVLYVGKPKLFEGFQWKLKDETVLKKLTSEGRSVICVGTSKGVEGLIAIRDEIRPQAKKVIDEFHREKIKVVVLTGDNEVTANAIASELGIDEVKANLSPENKSEIIKELKGKYKTVAMVGDGINDAPALAQASVGIAMGTGGTDTAIEAADVALMADDLSKVPYAIRLGKRARGISGQNITFSILLLAVMIPLALFGVMSVAFAVFVHETSEILAVLNGLRMRRVK